VVRQAKRLVRAAGPIATAALLFSAASAQATPVIHEFPLKTASSHPIGMALGADGNIWFAENSADQVGMVTPGGVVTEFGGLSAGAGPENMTSGPAGKVWFT
jgi:streptogramin lyase